VQPKFVELEVELVRAVELVLLIPSLSFAGGNRFYSIQFVLLNKKAWQAALGLNIIISMHRANYLRECLELVQDHLSLFEPCGFRGLK